MVDISIVDGGYKLTYKWGGVPHCIYIYIRWLTMLLYDLLHWMSWECSTALYLGCLEPRFSKVWRPSKLQALGDVLSKHGMISMGNSGSENLHMVFT